MPAIAGAPEEYVKESPALVNDATMRADTRPSAEERRAQRKVVEPRARQGRALWLLVGWLVVSISTIAIAGITIAKYF